VFPVLLGEQFLPGCVDIRADSILGHVSDSSPLADGVALGFLDDPIDRLVDRAVAGRAFGYQSGRRPCRGIGERSAVRVVGIHGAAGVVADRHGASGLLALDRGRESSVGLVPAEVSVGGSDVFPDGGEGRETTSLEDGRGCARSAPGASTERWVGRWVVGGWRRKTSRIGALSAAS